MPRGTPFHGLIPPFPIRVDQFGASPELTAVPALYLLSHTHSDHILGLSAKSFASTIICSPDAKKMLLRHELYSERFLRDVDLRNEARLSKTFGHLKVSPCLKDGKLDFSVGRDFLRTVPLHAPTKIELSDNLTVTLTLFDANHCPGAVMFLVEDGQCAVLHTGDFRAEPWFLDDIRRNPFLQPYLAPPEVQESAVLEQGEVKCSGSPLFKTLDTIYLDTECLLTVNEEVPTKGEATQGLISLISLFSPETTFFINAWTWGYEDIFRAIALSFQSQIHVDRYKHNIYSHLTDPFLRSLITLDASKSRFHACERFNRCPNASRDDVVYINPVTIGKSKWHQYLALTRSKLSAAQPVTVLLVPLLRHSPLQELRAFVSLFRPVRVVPNSLDPSLRGFDALCIPNLFADCLSTPPSHVSSSFDEALVEGDIEGNDDHCDSALQNLVGDGADRIAHTWAVSGRNLDKLTVMEPYLRGTARDAARRALGIPPLPDGNSDKIKGAISILERMRDLQRINACRSIVAEHESGRETESEDEDTHARTAKLLFGVAARSQMVGSQGISHERTPSSQSPRDMRPSVEEGSGKDIPDPQLPPALHASTLPVSERGSQQKIAKGTFRRRTNSDVASPQTQLINNINTKDTRMMRPRNADHKPSSFRPVAHTPSLSSLTSPAKNQPLSTRRHDQPLMNLKNIPLTGTKRASVHLYSSSPSKKRSKDEKYLNVYADEDPVFASSRRETTNASGVASIEAEQLTDAAPESGCTRERGPDVDEETRRSQRRALRARSRAIEEKLRYALVSESRQSRI